MADVAALTVEMDAPSSAGAPGSVLGAILRDGLLAVLLTGLVRRIALRGARQ